MIDALTDCDQPLKPVFFAFKIKGFPKYGLCLVLLQVPKVFGARPKIDLHIAPIPNFLFQAKR